MALYDDDPQFEGLDDQEINITVGILSLELVVSLLYIAYVSRPSFLFAVNCLSHIQAHIEGVPIVCADSSWCNFKKS